MKPVHEMLRENVERWEIRGRGVLTFPERVSPRPPFAPFPGHRLKELRGGDDGVRHTAMSGLIAKLGSLIRGINDPQPALPDSNQDQEDDEEIEPHWCGEETELVELRMRLPEGLNVTREAVAHLLTSMGDAAQPLVFEIIGNKSETWTQWVAGADDAEDLHRQMQAHFPQVKLSASNDSLVASLPESGEMSVVEFALSNAFMLPLASVKSDPFVTLIGALSSLAEDELGFYQVIFTPLMEPWAEHATSAVTKADGRPFFDDGASLVKATQLKTEGPLFGVVVRMAGIAPEYERAWQIVRGMATTLRHFSRAGGNEFMPLNNDDYDHRDHIDDLLDRRTRRCGMLLNLDELTGLVHLPSAAVQSKKFRRIDTNTRAVEPHATCEGVCIGINQHDGDASEVWLTREQRVRHCHILGGTGTGKSTLLFSMIQQDIANGEGIAVLDPHGDLIDRVLRVIPPERVNDVVLFDPADEQFVIPFNILSARSDFEKQLLASDLVSVFQRLSTSWGDQMNSVFQNAVLAFLESCEGGTLSDLRRFLLDAEWREQFLQTVSDPDVRFYWKRAFPQLGGNKSIGPIITRLETFLSPKPIRYMVSQRENRLDFGGMMDSGKIFLAKLPQGQIGRENAFLLGSLVMTKLQQMAMSRARVPEAKRRPFYCYIDEFHHFITPSLTEILSGARKYGLGLVLAHQDLKQLDKDKDVSSSVLSNAFTRIAFRVGDSDARSLADGFAHFESRDLQGLAIGQAIARIERANNDFNLSVPVPDEVDELVADEQRLAAIGASRRAYAVPRKDIEAEILRRLEVDDAASSKTRKVKEPRAVPTSESGPPSPPAPHESSSETGAVELEIELLKPNIEPVTATPKPPPDVPAEGIAVATARPSDNTKVPAPPPEAGKGGYQHRILQDRIRAIGEQQGFRVMLEMPTSVGRESIDVGLVRSDMRIACEISVTTTIDHEVGNVRKCLRENFDLIAIITSEERRLRQIEAAVSGCFDQSSAARVSYFQPDAFLAYLSTLAPPPEPQAVPSAPAPAESVRKGYKVKRVFTQLTPEERAARESAAFKLLVEEMKLPPRPE